MKNTKRFLFGAVVVASLAVAPKAFAQATTLTFHGISETPSRTGFPPKAYFQ